MQASDAAFEDSESQSAELSMKHVFPITDNDLEITFYTISGQKMSYGKFTGRTLDIEV